MLMEISMELNIAELIFDECFNWSKDKIKEMFNQKKSSQESYVTLMYQAVINSLNTITYNQYSNCQDVIYDASELLFQEWEKCKVLNKNIIIKIFSKLSLKIYEDMEENFITCLREEIASKPILLNHYLLKSSDNVFQEITTINHGVDTINKNIKQLEEMIDKKNPPEEAGETNYILETKKEYLEKWKSKLFLHKNEEDNLTLENTFIMPNYIPILSGRIGEVTTGLKERLLMYFQMKTNIPVIIQGPPGIGKTSISSWITSELYENDDFYILKCRDWETDELEQGLMKALCNTIGCQKREIKDKIIVLDGFDEIKEIHKGNHLLKKFIEDVNNVSNLKVIITMRSGYVSTAFLKEVYCLQHFDNLQIHDFYESITKKKLPDTIFFKKNEVIGIPVILYMAIATGIDISIKRSKVELYNLIFDAEGGIFDKFSADGKYGYDYGNNVLRSSDNKKIFIKFLRDIACKMMIKNTLSLEKDQYEIPNLEYQDQEIKILDFPIKNLFEKTEKLEFVHKTIFEYFAAEHIYHVLSNCLESSEIKIQELEKELGFLFNENLIDEEIWVFLKYRIQLNDTILKKYNEVNKMLNEMIYKGMLYETGILYECHLKREAYVFYNLLMLLGLWRKSGRIAMKIDEAWISYFILAKNEVSLPKLYMANIDFDNHHLKCYDFSDINFTNSGFNICKLQGTKFLGATLIDAGFVGANMSYCDCRNANFTKADLRHAIMQETDFSNSDLTKTDFRQAKLINTKFINVKIDNTIFSESQIAYLEKIHLKDIRRILVALENGKKIPYDIYKKRNKK